MEPGKTAVSLAECRLFCDVNPGTLWPRVNGKITLGQSVVRINPSAIHFNVQQETDQIAQFWKINEDRFREQISRKFSKPLGDSGAQLNIVIDVENKDGVLNFNTNEHYSIQAGSGNGMITANIKAETIFGARHALETISQLIIFDDLNNELLIVDTFQVDDKPTYPHRGFLLDTVRNYFPIEAIKRTIGRVNLSE